MSSIKYQTGVHFNFSLEQWGMALGVVVICLAEIFGLLAPVQSKLEEIGAKIEAPVFARMNEWVLPIFQVEPAQIDEQTLLGARLVLAEELSQLTDLEQLRLENESLRTALGLAKNEQLMNQRMIAEPVAALSQPKINLGRRSGVSAGSLVFSPQGILLGRVTKVEENISLVDLLVSKQFSPLLAKTQTGVEGLARGNGFSLKLTEVPQAVPIKVGERVITLGQEGIPARLPLGVVAQVKSSPTSATQDIIIDQLVNFYQLPLVMVGI